MCVYVSVYTYIYIYIYIYIHIHLSLYIYVNTYTTKHNNTYSTVITKHTEQARLVNYRNFLRWLSAPDVYMKACAPQTKKTIRKQSTIRKHHKQRSKRH